MSSLALRRSAALVGVAAVSVLATAPNALAVTRAPKITNVGIDCTGDVLFGKISVTGATKDQRLSVTLLGNPPLARTIATQSLVIVKDGSVTEPYSFNIAGHHADSYKVQVKPEQGAVVVPGVVLPVLQVQNSDVMPDSFCAPPTQVPEIGNVVALPAAFAAAGGLFMLARRRRVRNDV